MNFSIAALALLAQQEQHALAEASEHFRQTKATFDVTDVIIGLAMLLVAALGIVFLKKMLERSEKQEGYRHPGKLFNELCAAHGLTFKERRLLRRLAASEDLESPSRMFIEPERYDAARIPESLNGRRDEVFALRDRLFAGNNEGEVSWLAPVVSPTEDGVTDDADQELTLEL